MENNYCAIVRECVQTSPDDWEMQTRVLEVSESTTMKQIADWYYGEHSSRELGLHITINKLSKPQP